MTKKNKQDKGKTAAELVDGELDAVKGGADRNLTITNSTLSGNSAHGATFEETDLLKSTEQSLTRR